MQIKNAIAAAFAPPTPPTGPSPIATIDARAFTGLQPCNTNPFTNGGNVSVRLLLGDVQIITSVPWWTPQESHSIEGTVEGDVPGGAGTVIAACGPGLGVWSSTNQNCSFTIGGTQNPATVHSFPYLPSAGGTGVALFPFNTNHGPFQPLAGKPFQNTCG